jgi:hypothetical protein
MNPEDSRRVGVSVGAPTVEDGSGSSGGQLSGAEAGGGSANRHRILPQHRGVIERHFQQDQ